MVKDSQDEEEAVFQMLQCKLEQREADEAQVRESSLRRGAVTDPYGASVVFGDG